jgi:hypothetical protein
VIDDALCSPGVDESPSHQRALQRLDPDHEPDATENGPGRRTGNVTAEVAMMASDRE